MIVLTGRYNFQEGFIQAMMQYPRTPRTDDLSNRDYQDGYDHYSKVVDSGLLSVELSNMLSKNLIAVRKVNDVAIALLIFDKFPVVDR